MSILTVFVVALTGRAVAKPEPSVTVSGIVVEALSDQRVADALIRLSRRDQAQTAIAVRSDANGTFTFANVGEGRYEVSASKGGYIFGVLGQRRVGDRGHLLAVSNENATGLRIPVWKEGSIAGRVSDGKGRPVPGVTVQAFGIAATAGRSVWVSQGRGRTDLEGVFRVGNLIAGTYMVVAGQGFPAGIPPTFFPAANTPDGADKIDLSTGEERVGVDIVSVSGRAYSISGRISGVPRTDQGTRVVVRVTLPDAGPYSNFVAGQSDASAVGTFRLAAIPPGRYSLEVYVAASENPGFAGSGEPRATPNDLDAQSLARGPVVILPITVSDRDMDLQQIFIPETVAVRGRVVLEPSLGQNTTPPRVHIYAFSADGRASIASSQDPSGGFMLADLQPGQYFLGGSIPSGWFVSRITARGVLTPVRAITVDERGLDDVLVYLTDKASEITGIVRTVGTQTPDPLSSVMAFPTDRTKWVDRGKENPFVRSGRSTPEGRFSIVGLPTGEYFVVGLREDLAKNWQAADRLEVLAQSATKVSIEGAQKVTVNVVSLSRLPNGR